MLFRRKSPTALVAIGINLLAARLGYVWDFLRRVSVSRSLFIAFCGRNRFGYLHGPLVGSFLLRSLTSEY